MTNGASGQRNPYPATLRRLLRKVLPHHVYRRHIGRHEDESMRLWTRIAARSQAGETILDIGAFQGEYALAAKKANPLAQVYAFEPNPRSLSTLRHTCRDAGVEVVASALAERDGEIPFVCRGEESQLIRSSSSVAESEEVVLVPAVTLDGWVESHFVVPVLIKIDVEGAEAGILRSAVRLLRDHQPVILCEVLSDEAGREVMAALPEHYRFFHIDENHGTSEERHITRRRWRNKNWLLVPTAKQLAAFA
jgi:FkbM family methyltransferase